MPSVVSASSTSTPEVEEEVEEPVGEVFLHIDVFPHPVTREHKVTVKVLSASIYSWGGSGILRPYVEVILVGPHLNQKKRKFSTKSKSSTLNPEFNETFRL